VVTNPLIHKQTHKQTGPITMLSVQCNERYWNQYNQRQTSAWQQ